MYYSTRKCEELARGVYGGVYVDRTVLCVPKTVIVTRMRAPAPVGRRRREGELHIEVIGGEPCEARSCHVFTVQ